MRLRLLDLEKHHQLLQLHHQFPATLLQRRHPLFELVFALPNGETVNDRKRWRKKGILMLFD